MQDLHGKHVIITGAASGIGRASALAFAEAGAKLILADMADLDGVLAAVRERGASAAGIRGDVADGGYVQSLVHACTEEYGAPHVLFANAGMTGDLQPLLEESADSWQRVLSVNLIGPFLAIKHVAPAMIAGGGGSIVLTASVAGLRSGAGPAAYSASKAGVVSLAQTASCQLATQGVRVNAICPGLIETGMTAPIFEYARAAGKGDRLGNKCPMQRPGQPDEVARVALFLASDASSYLTGQAIAVDGGLTATHPFVPGRFI